METVFTKSRVHEPAFFSPSDTTDAIPDFPKLCVSTFSNQIIQEFLSRHENEKIAELCTANGPISIYRTFYLGHTAAFYLSPIGGPSCAACFEELAAMGARRFVFFGSCGILDDEKTAEHIIIPLSAVRDEGTSYHYLPPSPEVSADKRNVEILKSVLTDLKYPYVEGKTWTTDALYRETTGAIQQRKKEGCIAVEMECASLLAVSRFRNLSFIQFLYGADSLSSDMWDIRDLRTHGLSRAEAYMRIALECGIRL